MTVQRAEAEQGAPEPTVDRPPLDLPSADFGGVSEPDQADNAEPGEPDEPDPEELIKRIFDPLLRRLRTELRLDRERRGLVSDLSGW